MIVRNIKLVSKADGVIQDAQLLAGLSISDFVNIAADWSTKRIG